MGVGSFILPQIGVSNEWQRPDDWLPMPTNITATDEIFVGLHAPTDFGKNPLIILKRVFICPFEFIIVPILV